MLVIGGGSESPYPSGYDSPGITGSRARIPPMRLGTLVLPTLFLAACGGDSEEPVEVARTESAGTELPEATYVGAAMCVECHEAAWEAWQGSHHDLAMQEISEVDVASMFTDTGPNEDGSTARTISEAGAPTLHTSEGQVPVAYAFGTTPLMQFLLQGRDGRMQAIDEV